MITENHKYKIALYETIRKFVIAHGKLDKEAKEITYEVPAVGSVPTMYKNAIGVTKVPLSVIKYHISDKTNTEAVEFYCDEKFPLGSLFNDRLSDTYKLDSVHQDKLDQIVNYLSQIS